MKTKIRTESTTKRVVTSNGGSRAAGSNILAEITQVVRLEVPKKEFYRQTFRLLAKHFGSNFALLNVRVGAQTLQDEYGTDQQCTEDVMAVVDAMIIEAEADEKANVRLFAKERGQNTAVLSAPIYAGPSHVGSICITTITKANKEARLLLSELITLIAFMGAQARTDDSRETPRCESSSISRALEKAAGYKSIAELAYAMVNNVAAKFNCEQVAFGLQNDQQVKLLAISGLDRYSRSSHGVTQIQQAMEECADLKETIHYQLAGGFGESSGKQSFLLHRQWHAAANNSSLLSIPLATSDNQVAAVVSLQRDSHRPFSESEIERIRGMLQPFAAVVRLLERASRTTLGQLKQGAKHCYESMCKPSNIGRKLAAAVLVTAALFFVFGRLPHRLVVPCLVESAAVNHVTAPFQGTLHEVVVKDGDHVIAGQTLALLDARPMKLERDRLRAEIATHLIEMDRALANRSVVEAAMAQSNINAAETQMGIIEDRIAKATIVAPVDGVILSGELDQRVGQQLMFGDALLELGTTGLMSVKLHVPEEMARFVKAEQAGRFAAFARPGTRLDFEVERITPSSVVVEDRNVFVADARLSATPTWMRVGMEGTAKVSIGWRPTWWVCTHTAIDKLRMALWW